jgi:hypothetical protein
VATVERAAAGAASGVIATMQRVGSVIGIAVVGSVLFEALPSKPTERGFGTTDEQDRTWRLLGRLNRDRGLTATPRPPGTRAA